MFFELIDNNIEDVNKFQIIIILKKTHRSKMQNDVNALFL